MGRAAPCHRQPALRDPAVSPAACVVTIAQGSPCLGRPGPNHSFAACSFIRRATRHSLGIAARAIPLSLVEYALDVELIAKGRDPRGDLRRHRNLTVPIAT